jgi:cobalt-zinc-cadmium efflux system outer membrane protein
MLIALQGSVKTLLTGLAVALALRAPIPGQNALPGEPLTLERALTLAEQHNPQLRAASAEVDASTAAILTARTRPNPEFNFLTGRQQALLPSSVTGRLDHYGFIQPLELPSLRRSRISTASYEHDSTEFSRAEARLLVRSQVKRFFYEALHRANAFDLARENLQLVEDLRRRIQVQVDVGEAARLELTRAEAEVSVTRTLVRSADLRRTTAIAALRGIVGGPLPENLAIEGTLETPVEAPSLDALRQEVLARAPALAGAQTLVRAAESRLEYEKAARKPQPSWIAEFEKMPDLWFFRTGVAVQLPFWNRRKGQIAEAEARVTQAEAGVNQQRLELVASIEAAYEEYQVANQQVASFETGVLREAQAALNAAEAAFRFGERGIIEVLDAQRVLRTARLDYLDAQYDRQLALIEIERLRTSPLGRNTP